MGLIDINSCSARQLTEYARIGKSLADSIIRYRRCYGGYKHFDELWKITGISRASYRNLQQYFYVGGQTVPAMGERLPNAKVAITESMLQMLTREHLAEQRAKRNQGPPLLAKSKVDKPAIRTTKSAKQGVNCVEWQLSTCDNVERVKSTPLGPNAAHSKVLPSESLDNNKNKVPVGDTSLEVDGKAFTSPRANHQESEAVKLNVSSQKIPRKAWEGTAADQDEQAARVVVPKEDVPDAVGPSVVLRASSSGNNINVSCTFDKKLLNSEKPVALKFNTKDDVQDSYMQQCVSSANVARDKDRVAAKRNGKERQKITGQNKPVCDSSKLETDKLEKEKSDSDKCRGRTGDKETAKVAKKREHSSNKKDEECQTHMFAELNSQNLEYFTAEKRVGAKKQKKIIETWVEDVNVHINNGTLERKGDGVLSKIEHVRIPPSAALVRKQLPGNERKAAKQPIKWQLKTKNITLMEDLAANERKSTAAVPNNNLSPTSLGANSFNVNGLWSRLRNIATTPFKGLYNNRLEDIPASNIRESADKLRKVTTNPCNGGIVDSQHGPAKRRHNEDKRMPLLHEIPRQTNRTLSSSSSSRQPRKSAKASGYEHLSYTYRDKGRSSLTSPSSRRWTELGSGKKSLKLSCPSPELSERHASKSWRDMQIQLLQKRLRQMKNSNFQPSRKKAPQKYTVSPEHRSIRKAKFI